ncbi:MAG: hypothetical protein ACTSUK_09320, partial [Promethearchaeota archaeon]
NEKMISDYFDIFLDLSEKKVEINVLVDETHLKIQNKNTWRKLASIAHIQLVKHVLFDAFLFDQSEMIIFLTSFMKIDIKDENMVFLIQENRLINYSKTYFKMLWSMGRKFSMREFNN